MTAKKTTQPWAISAEHHLTLMQAINSDQPPELIFSMSINNLSDAINDVQTKIGSVYKGSKVDAGRIRYKYAQYVDVVEALTPHLDRTGLSFVQPLGNGCVWTMLMHTSGEFILSRYPYIVENSGMKGEGSSISYAKRYALLAILGIPTSDEDDDAQKADGHAGLKPKAPGKKVRSYTVANHNLSASDIKKQGTSFSALWGLQADISSSPPNKRKSLKDAYRECKEGLVLCSIGSLSMWFKAAVDPKSTDAISPSDVLSTEQLDGFNDMLTYFLGNQPDGKRTTKWIERMVHDCLPDELRGEPKEFEDNYAALTIAAKARAIECEAGNR